ncbi:MAG: integrase catalytic domain-containing protein [Bacteroidetes bacterium]|nr:integrase catalytic domain-containing protein [Bacteroidota bacterium]
MTKQFLELLREHISISARENNLKIITIEKREYMLNNITAYLQNCGMHNATPEQIRPRHMDELKEWIYKNTPTRTRAHINRHIRLCSGAIDLAVRRDMLPYNCLTSIRLKRDADKQIIALNETEVQKFVNFRCEKIPFRNVVRDLFLFQCYTGLSYCDLWRFEIMRDNSITWITCAQGRGKTGRVYWSELTAEAAEILKCNNGEFPLVIMQSYNRTLQKIARSLGIKKHLTTHIARKTFASYMRRRGFSIPAIADMLGNTESVARKHYVEQTRELVAREILRLNELGNPMLKIA